MCYTQYYSYLFDLDNTMINEILGISTHGIYIVITLIHNRALHLLITCANNIKMSIILM